MAHLVVQHVRCDWKPMTVALYILIGGESAPTHTCHLQLMIMMETVRLTTL